MEKGSRRPDESGWAATRGQEEGPYRAANRTPERSETRAHGRKRCAQNVQRGGRGPTGRGLAGGTRGGKGGAQGPARPAQTRD